MTQEPRRPIALRAAPIFSKMVSAARASRVAASTRPKAVSALPFQARPGCLVWRSAYIEEINSILELASRLFMVSASGRHDSFDKTDHAS